MVSAISGNAVAGIASGNISGRVSLDGGAQAVCAGPVIEDGGGQYHLNIFAADITGNNAGFFFTASGCVPVSFTAVTQQNVSGRLFTGSGLTYPASGASVVSVPYSGSLSGQLVGILSGQMSGQLVNLLSGNQTFVYSGSLSGQLVGLLSGQRVEVLSGTAVNLFSGTAMAPASGSLSVSSFASGVLTVDVPQSILKADYSGMVGEAQRSLLNATRKLINKWDTSTSGKLTIYKENDSTVAYIQDITATSGAVAITALDTE